jgi:hypothetical protein
MVLTLHNTVVIIYIVWFNNKRPNMFPLSLISLFHLIPVNSTVQLIFVMEILCVCCGVETEFFKYLDFLFASVEVDFLT